MPWRWQFIFGVYYNWLAYGCRGGSGLIFRFSVFAFRISDFQNFAFGFQPACLLAYRVNTIKQVILGLKLALEASTGVWAKFWAQYITQISLGRHKNWLEHIRWRVSECLKWSKLRNNDGSNKGLRPCKTLTTPGFADIKIYTPPRSWPDANKKFGTIYSATWSYHLYQQVLRDF